MVKSLAQNLLDPTPSETSLYWRLSRAEPTLYLSIDPDSGAGSDLAIPLSEENAQRIHTMSVTTSSLAVNIQVNGHDVPIHLIGRKVSCTEWAGTASSWFDTSSVARDLLQGLLFAEQVVSEANSVIVILDREGKIQRFNRLCEEYTGVKEQDVIGKTAFELFMSAPEAAAARENVSRFLATAGPMKWNAGSKPAKGHAFFCFATASSTAVAVRTRSTLSVPAPILPRSAKRKNGCGCWRTPTLSPACPTVMPSMS